MVAVGFAPTALGSLPRARNSLNKVAPIIMFRRLLVRPTIAGRARPDVSSSMSRSAPCRCCREALVQHKLRRNRSIFFDITKRNS